MCIIFKLLALKHKICYLVKNKKIITDDRKEDNSLDVRIKIKFVVILMFTIVVAIIIMVIIRVIKEIKIFRVRIFQTITFVEK